MTDLRFVLPQIPCVLVVEEGRAFVSRLPSLPGGDNSILVVDIELGEVVSEIAISSQASSAVVAGGSVWFTLREGGRVMRIDPSTAEVESVIEVGALANTIEEVDGSLWITVGVENEELVQLDPTSESVLQRVDLSDIGSPTFLTAGFGSLWVTFGDDDVVARINSATGEVVATIDVAPGPFGVATLADAIWVAHQPGLVSRIDPDANLVDAEIPVQGRTQVVFAIDGELWVPDGSGSGISRIDPSAVGE
jgi:streptogramin lyase